MSKSKGIRPRHSEETKEAILLLKTQGVADKLIAEQLGVKFAYVRNVLRKNPDVRVSEEQHNANRKVSRRLRIKEFPPEITDQILEMYFSGSKKSEICKKLDVTYHKIKQDLEKFGNGRQRPAKQSKELSQSSIATDSKNEDHCD